MPGPASHLPTPQASSRAPLNIRKQSVRSGPWIPTACRATGQAAQHRSNSNRDETRKLNRDCCWFCGLFCSHLQSLQAPPASAYGSHQAPPASIGAHDQPPNITKITPKSHQNIPKREQSLPKITPKESKIHRRVDQSILEL